MRKLFHLLVILILCISFVNCDKTDNSNLGMIDDKSISNIQAQLVDIKDISNIKNEIDGKLRKSRISWSSRYRESSDYWLDESHIIKLVDSIGNETYSIAIKSKKSEPDVIYNLISTIRVNDEHIEPFVMAYTFFEGNKYSYASQSDKTFNGKVDVYSLVEFASNYGLAEQTIEPTPCYDDIYDPDLVPVGSNSSPSGGSSNSGGTSGGGDSGYSVSSFSSGGAIVYSNTGGSGPTGSVEVGVGTFTSEVCETCQEQRNTVNVLRTSDDCPEGELVIPINEEQNANFLCGGYNWSTIGSAHVSNITGLGLQIAGPFGQVYNVEWANLCVTIPNYNVMPFMATERFNNAWNTSMTNLANYLNLTLPDGMINMNNQELAALVREFLHANLNSLVPGSSITSGYCSGASDSQADYCN